MGTLREWPTKFRVGHLPIIKTGGRLIVEIVDGNWWARIQGSESIALQEYESLLEEHEKTSFRIGTIKQAADIFDTLEPSDANKAAKFERDHANLKSLLQIIVNYIIHGRAFDPRRPPRSASGKPNPAKFAFRLMSRTSFYSMYHQLLTEEEQVLFKKLVKTETIPTKLGLKNSDSVFKKGHGEVAAEDSPKIGDWLISIYKGGGPLAGKKGRTDIMSRPRGGSAAMGQFDVETGRGKKDSSLVKFEVRGTEKHGGTDHPRANWVKYARDLFESALKKRSKRPGILKADVKKTKLLDE
jgi:hypothetical protein